MKTCLHGCLHGCRGSSPDHNLPVRVMVPVQLLTGAADANLPARLLGHARPLPDAPDKDSPPLQLLPAENLLAQVHAQAPGPLQLLRGPAENLLARMAGTGAFATAKGAC